MSKTIDERVVEMRFDNKEFESRAKESIGTLTKLKEALNISTKDSAKSLDGLNQAAKSVSLDGIAAGVEALQKRFSTLGIVGMRVIENITDSMMNTLGRGINFVSDSIVSGGIRRAMNIENAHFQLQALLKDETKVQAVMDDAMKSVDGTAYAYDEAAKAASQFAASGIEAGDEMLNALRGIVGVSAMTNSEFEGISQIFTTVAGNGRLMGDQLLQLGSRGLNAAATIADFVNGVTDGSKQASAEVTALVKNITKGSKITQGDIRELVSDGQISFKLFSEAMTDAFADSAERANETFTGALSNIKSALARIGAGFISPLVAQNSEVVKLFNAVRERVNDVKKALVFDEEIGNVNALSKQFTDAVLFMAKGAANFIENVDLSKPMEVFYYWVESVKNLGKGLFSVLKPLGQAFSEVFLSFSIDDVVNLSAKIEEVTRNMRFTERGSKELKDAFKGLFSVVKLVVDIFIDLVRVFVPISNPLNTLTGGILGLAGAVGRSLTAFTEWFRGSTRIHKTYEVISNSVKTAMQSFSNFMMTIGNFAYEIYKLEPVQELIQTISNGFKQLGIMAYDAIAAINGKLVEFKMAILNLFPSLSGTGLKARIEQLADTINKAIKNINKIDLSKASKVFESFKNVLNSLLEVLKGNEGLNVFVTNMKKFFEDLTDAFSVDRILEKVETFRETIDGFVKWIKGLLGPLSKIFEGFTIGGAVSTAGGFGIIYAIIKMAKSFEKVSTTIQSLPNILGSLNGAIKEYQKNLKAETLKTVAEAILILAAALTILSFADTERVMKSAVALSMIAGVLLLGVDKFVDVAKRTKTIEDVMYGFSKAANNLAKGVKWKAIGSAFKDFGLSVLMIIGSIAAIAYMYRKDPEALQQAEIIVGVIAGALAAFSGLMIFVSNKFDKGASNFSKSALGVLALSASLTLAISALKKLFDIDLPTDWKTKVGILAGIFGGLGILAFALGRATKETSSYMHSGDSTGGSTASASTSQGKMGAGPILALAATLYVSVLALEKLFKMELPTDYGIKIAILAGIFLALGGLVLAVGYASKLAGGAIKATGAILAMCLFVGVAVAALMILSIFPDDKLIKGAVSLGILLGALAAALWGAGKVIEPNAYKSILSMALTVGAITVSLAVLSMVPLTELFKSAVALGAILLVLAKDFTAAGKISSDKGWLNILAMVAVVLSVAISLYELAQQPWESLLAAGVSMSMVMLTFSTLLKQISSTKGIDQNGMGTFLLAIGSLVLIAYSLYELAGQPWDGLLAAGVALSAVLLSFAASFRIISGASVDQSAISIFLAGIIGIVGIGIVLYELAGQPWQGLLAAAGAVSAVLLALSVSLGILSKLGVSVGPATQAALALDAFIVILAAVMVGLGALFEEVSFLEGYLDKGIEILVKVGEGLGRFAGAIVSGVLQEISNSFPVIGENLSAFMEAGKPFFDGIKEVDDGTVKSVAYLAEAILLMTASSVLDGLTSWFTGGSSMVQFGEELAEFAPYFASYAASIDGIDSATVEASANAALALAEMATKLPNSGGLAAKIFGDNSLSEFGEELKVFGPILADYAESIKDVNPEVVEASANAAQVMADMANTLPNSGGLAAKIFGDNTLSSFGEELSKFGPYLADYAESVDGLNGDVVTNSANAAKALSELANELPNSGGLVSWFTGDNDISKFGNSLVKFGEGMYSYYESVSGIEISKLGGVITEVKKLVDLANGMAALDTSGMTRFSSSLKTMATNGITDFITTFTNSSEQVANAINTMILYATNAITAKNDQFKTTGTKSANSWILGFKSKFTEATSTGTNLALKVLAALQAKISDFMTKGTAAANQYLQGIKNKYPEANSTGETLANKVLSGIESVSPKFQEAGKSMAESILKGLESLEDNFYKAGENAGKGFVDGLNSKKKEAEAAAKALAEIVQSAAKVSLDEHSPSKKMWEIGKNAGLGFVNALMGYVVKAAEVGEEIGHSTVDGANSAISNISKIINWDLMGEPVIRPTVDLTDVHQSIREINDLFNSAVSATANNAVAISGIMRANNSNENFENIQNGQFSRPVQNFVFNQVNNSPKALERIEIYRQTNNQFARFKREVESSV